MNLPAQSAAISPHHPSHQSEAVTRRFSALLIASRSPSNATEHSTPVHATPRAIVELCSSVVVLLVARPLVNPSPSELPTPEQGSPVVRLAARGSESSSA